MRALRYLHNTEARMATRRLVVAIEEPIGRPQVHPRRCGARPAMGASVGRPPSQAPTISGHEQSEEPRSLPFRPPTGASCAGGRLSRLRREGQSVGRTRHGSTPGPTTNRYGGNTSCLQVTLSDGRLLVLDAGSGIRNLGLRLAGRARRIDILLTHLHLDHIQGLLFFRAPVQTRRRNRHLGPARPRDAVRAPRPLPLPAAHTDSSE